MQRLVFLLFLFYITKVPAFLVGGALAQFGYCPAGIATFSVCHTKCHIWCGGFFVTKKHIVSAAHCFALPRIPPLNISTGLGLNEILTNVKIQKIHLFRNFNKHDKSWEHDIAVITLDQYVDVIPLEMGSSYCDMLQGKARLCGLGKTENDTYPPHMRMGQTLLVPKTGLPGSIGESVKRSQLITCGWPRTSNGDSGIPLMQRGRVIAISSHVTKYSGIKCSVYTCLSNYKTWLAHALR